MTVRGIVDKKAAQRWAEQWKRAAPALAAQKREELSAMTPEMALAASEAVLQLADPSKLSASRERWSGLVEQQTLFRKVTSR